MTATSALRDGIGRVSRAPLLLFGVFGLTLLLALPLGLVVRGMIGDSLGASLEADRLASAFDYDWWQEFAGQASGLGASFGPAVIGRAAVLTNLSAMLDATPQATAVAGAGLLYIGCWISSRAESSTGSPGIIRPTLEDSSPPRAYSSSASCGWPRWPGRLTCFSISSSTAGCSAASTPRSRAT